MSSTFGNTSNGASSNNLNHNPTSGPNAVAWRGTSPSDMGTVLSISGYFSGSGTNQLAIWDGSGNLIANSAISFTVASTGWITKTYATPPILLPNTVYFIGYVSGSLSTFYYVNNFSSGGDTFAGGTTSDSTPTNVTNPAFSNNSGAGGYGNGGGFYLTYNPAAAQNNGNMLAVF